MEPRDRRQNETAILKELSDINKLLAVNTTETANIKDSITEIKTDVRHIKEGTVSRRELDDVIQPLKEEVATLKKYIFGTATMVIGGIITAIVKTFFNQ